MEGIVPLYYNMKKAGSGPINAEALYNGLTAAFTGGNIGIYSNNISKIWNSAAFVSGTKEEKEETLDLIKLLCMENNFVIDFAKTLYKPKRPKEIQEKIVAHTKNNLPHFFKFAKDKNDEQVEIVNPSFVNKLSGLAPRTRINFKKIGLNYPDFRLMMTNPDSDCKVRYLGGKHIDTAQSDPIAVLYNTLFKEYSLALERAQVLSEKLDPDIKRKASVRESHLLREVKNRALQEFSQIEPDENIVVDKLVRYLYDYDKGKQKGLLWLCYGDLLYKRLLDKIGEKDKAYQCVDCGEWFYNNKYAGKITRCPRCQKEYIKMYDRQRKAKRRNSVLPTPENKVAI